MESLKLRVRLRNPGEAGHSLRVAPNTQEPRPTATTSIPDTINSQPMALISQATTGEMITTHR